EPSLLNSCGTGILPVAEPSLLNSCGTGILPVAENTARGELAPNHQLTLADIDLVVDGDARSGNAGAGVELASELQKLYPTARLDVHGQFQTAALFWNKDSPFGSLWLDIATARTEFYAYPAANPEVEASSIRQDLYRRDFTINALAVRLGVPRSGELLDFFGGLLDLQSKQIRVLHANSLIEDPTRIYRAVRFAVRLGFTIEPQTEGYIRHALASGVYDRIQGENGRAPALETRLKSELKYILQAPYWQVALQMLGDLQALRCIHPTLDLNRELWHQLRLLERFLHGRKFGNGFRNGFNGCKGLMLKEATIPNSPSPIPNSQFPIPNSQFPIINIPDWQMRLEVLIAYLAPEYRGKVATNLQLPVESIKRLQELSACNHELLERLPKCELPSQLVLLLRNYELPMLIAIALQSPRSIRHQIWEFFTKWVNVTPPLNGNDLKALGYKPSPGFKLMLDDLLAARLDGHLRDRTSAISFLAQHYPQSK
ncbi:MAG: CCA tRNA nucleotidyltransferase, partial [Oscillatoriales cyanobacterium]